MSIAAALQHCLAFFGTPLGIEPSQGQLSGDAGLLPIRPFDPYIGLTSAFAEALDDLRDWDLTEHAFPEMVRARGDDRAETEQVALVRLRHSLGIPIGPEAAALLKCSHRPSCDPRATGRRGPVGGIREKG
jgi:hypothetical protein